MKYGSVCSGIEAATAAWHHLGWEPSWFSEIEPFPSAVLEYHYPTIPNFGDMTKFKEWPDDPIELLVGGTPCQSFSVAGLRKGLDDPRGNLMLTYLAILNQHKPKWLVWENVPGVLSSNGGKDFGTFLGGLAELGYGFAYRVLDAQYFGVPQRRKRVFVVGCLGNWRAAAAVLFELHSLQGNTPPIREARQNLTLDTSPSLRAQSQSSHRADSEAYVAGTLNAGAGRRRGAGIAPESLVAFGGNNTSGSIDISTAIKGNNSNYDFESETFITGPVLHNGKAAGSATNQDAENGMLVVHGTQDPLVSEKAFPLGRNNGGENVLLQKNSPGPDLPSVATRTANTSANGHGISEELAHTLDQANGQAVGVTIHGTNKTVKTASYTDVAGALRTKPPGSTENSSTTAALQNMAVRRLTPIECERLQGFPDNFTQIPWRKKAAESCPDGPRYKALGNSMAVPVMRWIGERIQAVDEVLKIENAA